MGPLNRGSWQPSKKVSFFFKPFFQMEIPGWFYDPPMWQICQNFCFEPNFHMPFWKFGKRHYWPPQPAKQVFASFAHKMSSTHGFGPNLAVSRVFDPNFILTNFQLSMNKNVRTADVFPFLDAIFWHFQPLFEIAAYHRDPGPSKYCFGAKKLFLRSDPHIYVPRPPPTGPKLSSTSPLAGQLCPRWPTTQHILPSLMNNNCRSQGFVEKRP